MARRALALVLIVLACSAQAGDVRVSWLRVPAYVPDDSAVEYRLRIPKHPENRALVVQAVDGGFVVSQSRVDVDGTSPSVRTYRWQLPAGELRLMAHLLDAHGEVYRASAPVTVYHVGP